jgi:hypothetical protein
MLFEYQVLVFQITKHKQLEFNLDYIYLKLIKISFMFLIQGFASLVWNGAMLVKVSIESININIKKFELSFIN